MAKLSTSCTPTNVFVLLSLAVCVMLATSAPTVRVHQANPARTLYDGITDTLQTIAMTYNTTNTTLTEEFHVTENKTEVVWELCRIVAYYHLVEAVDNGSDIHSNLRVNANHALAYWRTTYCSACNVDLTEFGRMCERAALHPMMNKGVSFWQ